MTKTLWVVRCKNGFTDLSWRKKKPDPNEKVVVRFE